MDQLQELAQWLDNQVLPGRWHDKIYSYCERGGDGSFWAEPLNAWSNGAFHLASILAFVIWLTAPGSRRGIFELLLIVLVFIIGTGSFLFHTLANRWSTLADVAPIGIFMLLYFGYTLKRFAGLGWILTVFGLGVFAYVLWQFGQIRCGPTLCLEGSIAYFPAFAVLSIMGLWLVVAGHAASTSLIGASIVFAVSLTLRTVDKTWCSATVFGDFGNVGTHLWWHLLNALLLFILLRAAILHGHPSTTASR